MLKNTAQQHIPACDLNSGHNYILSLLVHEADVKALHDVASELLWAHILRPW